MSAENIDLIQQGWKHYHEGQDYEKAMAFFKEALKQGYPNAADNLVELGNSYRSNKEDFRKAFDCYQLALDNGHPNAKNSLIELSAAKSEGNLGLLGSLDAYFACKDSDNYTGIRFTLFGQASDDDTRRVAIAQTLVRKLAGEESQTKFSLEEINLIFSSDRLKAILGKPEYAWVAEKLQNEWAAEPLVQNNAQSSSNLRNSR